MKIMFSAGEASGDTHGASVAKALRALDPSIKMFGMGGDLMAEAGVRVDYDIKNLGYIGIVEIVKALPSFFKLRDFLKQKMIDEKPDVLVCIDYPGFNMRLAKVAHKLGIPVVYYIAPTIWAWHKSRGKDIKKYVRKVASIFPFEAKAYEEFDCDVEFVGHPLIDIVKPSMTKEEAQKYFGVDPSKKSILLMPGSRKQEIEGLLPTMLGAARKVSEHYHNLQFFLPRAHTIDKERLEEIIGQYQVPVTITEGNNYDLMGLCDICLAASGTATLETALMDLPTILMYKVAPVTYAIAKVVVNIKYVGLPNIVAGREVIPELLQYDVTVPQVVEKLTYLLANHKAYEQMKQDLVEVKEKLGAPGAVNRVAQLIRQVAGEEALHG